jgi:iron complex transport system permease protein
MSILVVGLMFSSFASAIVSTLTYFSSAEQLQKFTFWTLGSLGNLSFEKIIIFTIVIGLGLFLSLLTIKTLDALLLGENYAKSLGVNIQQQKNLILVATSLLAGTISAFVGPIAFIGLAIPHFTRLIFNTSQHKVLFFGNIFIGAILMLVCDAVSQMPGQEFSLPINTITSIVGAPVIIWLLLKRK